LPRLGRTSGSSAPLPPSAGALSVDFPHANIELPFNDFDEAGYQLVSCYQKRIAVPPAPEGKGFVYLDFEGIASCAEVYVEGELAAAHLGGYTPFAVPLSAWAGREVLVTVKVDSTERPDVPPFGNVIDYLTYGGIYREASLRALPGVFISNVFPRPRWDSAASAGTKASLSATVFLAAAAGASFKGRIALVLSKAGRELSRVELPLSSTALAGAPAPRSASGEALSSAFELDFGELEGIEPWSVEDPVLYDLRAELSTDAAPAADAYSTRIGFRSAEMRSEGFYLNGEKLVLRGLDRHQSYPYAGYAMPARVQRRDAEILKRELAVNCVRSSHYPPSRHFLDACDELGLLVIEEMPGWQHIGDAAWKDRAVENVREMIVRDWAHPSVFLWGVRINESRDDHDFYVRTNVLAHALDPTRQTCGIRGHEGSELLEDVYTMNDFILGSGEVALRFQRQVTGLSRNVPYLVTESVGHMYPARRYDNEERLVELAMRHARVHNEAGLNGDTGGALAWVFADYNTHYEFGAGDRVCYHGVMDMYRIPKLAAFGYAAQRESSLGPVLEPLTVWARGERSECSVMPLVVMTNCDEVGLVVGAAVGIEVGQVQVVVAVVEQRLRARDGVVLRRKL